MRKTHWFFCLLLVLCCSLSVRAQDEKDWEKEDKKREHEWEKKRRERQREESKKIAEYRREWAKKQRENEKEDDKEDEKDKKEKHETPIDRQPRYNRATKAETDPAPISTPRRPMPVW